MEDKQINFGLDLNKNIEDSKRETNYQLGAVDKEVLMPDGQWLEFKPECEIQRSELVDYMDCVTESAINGLSILMQKKLPLLNNWSQRFTAKMSGTTKSGNSLYAVSDCIRNKGLVLETDWTRNSGMNWNTYYAAIPTSVIGKGKKWTLQFDASYEMASTSHEALKQALKYGPVQVIGYAWAFNNEKGLYDDYGMRANHAFLLIGYVEGKKWIVYDSYPTDNIIDSNSTKQEFIKELTWDFNFADAMLYSIKLKATDQTSWLYKLMAYLKEVIRDIHGGYWFVKGGKRQSINTVGGILTILARQFGVSKDNVSDEEIKKWTVTNEFFN